MDDHVGVNKDKDRRSRLLNAGISRHTATMVVTMTDCANAE
jgi:hypothetical protein